MAYTYDQICSMITARLQQQLSRSNPYYLRDIYIRASRKRGSNLYDSELEEKWLMMVAEDFNDKVLRALIITRTKMYESHAQYQHNKVA